jgi:diguanylate cyclase (GGDEF)-like protein
MSGLYRKDDAVIEVCQINSRKMIAVRQMNHKAESILGVKTEDILGEPLTDILADDVNEAIDDYVEFSDDGNDLGDVLGKFRKFAVKKQDGSELPLKLKIIRSEAKDRNSWFRLIMQPEAEDNDSQSFLEMLRENFKGHEQLDDSTGLPNRDSIEKNLELVQHHCNTGKLRACFAVLRVDGHEGLSDQQREAVAEAMLTYLADACRDNIRDHDTIGYLGGLGKERLGIILLNLSSESARAVLNRIRWHMTANPMPGNGGEEMPVMISISYTSIMANNPESSLDKCEQALQSLERNQNMIVEVGL